MKKVADQPKKASHFYAIATAQRETLERATAEGQVQGVLALVEKTAARGEFSCDYSGGINAHAVDTLRALGFSVNVVSGSYEEHDDFTRVSWTDAKE